MALPACPADYFNSSEPLQTRVCKSLKLWSMFANLEESLGTTQSTKVAYDCILELRIAMPLTVIHYAM